MRLLLVAECLRISVMGELEIDFESKGVRNLASSDENVEKLDHTPTEDVLKAAAWGALSASSLIIGSTIGIFRPPSILANAAFMAFGAGALIEALSIELFGHILLVAEERNDKSLPLIAIICAIAGGMLFAELDKFLNKNGAFYRKFATTKEYVRRLRAKFATQLIKRLRRVPMFSELPQEVLEELLYGMIQERYREGEVIFEAFSEHDSSVNFILNGKVQVTTFMDEGNHTFLLGPDNLFGEMSIFTGYNMQCCAQALEDNTKILRIPEPVLQKTIQENDQVKHFISMMASQRLRDNDLFKLATPSTLARVVTRMRQHHFDADDVLFHDIDAMCPIFLIVLGGVQVTYDLDIKNMMLGNDDDSKNGETTENGVELTQLHARSWLNSMQDLGSVEIEQLIGVNGVCGIQHLLTSKSIRAMAVAIEPTTVLQISREDFDELLGRDESLRKSVNALRDKWEERVKTFQKVSGFPSDEDEDVSKDVPPEPVHHSVGGSRSKPSLGFKEQTKIRDSLAEAQAEGNEMPLAPMKLKVVNQDGICGESHIMGPIGGAFGAPVSAQSLGRSLMPPGASLTPAGGVSGTDITIDIHSPREVMLDNDDHCDGQTGDGKTEGSHNEHSATASGLTNMITNTGKLIADTTRKTNLPGIRSPRLEITPHGSPRMDVTNRKSMRNSTNVKKKKARMAEFERSLKDLMPESGKASVTERTGYMSLFEMGWQLQGNEFGEKTHDEQEVKKNPSTGPLGQEDSHRSLHCSSEKKPRNPSHTFLTPPNLLAKAMLMPRASPRGSPRGVRSPRRSPRDNPPGSPRASPRHSPRAGPASPTSPSNPTTRDSPTEENNAKAAFKAKQQMDKLAAQLMATRVPSKRKSIAEKMRSEGNHVRKYGSVAAPIRSQAIASSLAVQNQVRYKKRMSTNVGAAGPKKLDLMAVNWVKDSESSEGLDKLPRGESHKSDLKSTQGDLKSDNPGLSPQVDNLSELIDEESVRKDESLRDNRSSSSSSSSFGTKPKNRRSTLEGGIGQSRSRAMSLTLYPVSARRSLGQDHADPSSKDWDDEPIVDIAAPVLNTHGEAVVAEEDLIAMEEAHHPDRNAAIIIWAGIMIDGVPESLVLGITANTATTSSLLTLVTAVFLANLPEAMSSAATMRYHKMRKRVILLMWSSITILTFFGAGLGSFLFPAGSETERGTLQQIAAIEGTCGGAMLCMIAKTVLPEAFHMGGDVVGMSCLTGFLCAMAVKAFS